MKPKQNYLSEDDQRNKNYLTSVRIQVMISNTSQKCVRVGFSLAWTYVYERMVVFVRLYALYGSERDESKEQITDGREDN